MAKTVEEVLGESIEDVFVSITVAGLREPPDYTFYGIPVYIDQACPEGVAEIRGAGTPLAIVHLCPNDAARLTEDIPVITRAIARGG